MRAIEREREEKDKERDRKGENGRNSLRCGETHARSEREREREVCESLRKHNVIYIKNEGEAEHPSLRTAVKPCVPRVFARGMR